jgi:hypothetical protein
MRYAHLTITGYDGAQVGLRIPHRPRLVPLPAAATTLHAACPIGHIQHPDGSFTEAFILRRTGSSYLVQAHGQLRSVPRSRLKISYPIVIQYCLETHTLAIRYRIAILDSLKGFEYEFSVLGFN